MSFDKSRCSIEGNSELYRVMRGSEICGVVTDINDDLQTLR